MKYTLFIAICLALLLGSCKKKSETTPVCNMTTFMYPGIDTLEITYDDQNRVTDYNYLRIVRVLMNYSGITATSTATNYMDTTRPLFKIFLNTSGNLASMTQGNEYGTTGSYVTYNFKYDNEEHLIRVEQTVTSHVSPSYTNFYVDSLVYENENLVHRYKLSKDHTQTDYSLSETYTMTYTSDLNKAGFFPVRFENVPLGIGDGAYLYPLIGKASKNLPAVTSIYNSLGALEYEVDYTIVLNADGYPKEENTFIAVTPPYTNHVTFDYTCK